MEPALAAPKTVKICIKIIQKLMLIANLKFKVQTTKKKQRTTGKIEKINKRKSFLLAKPNQK